MILAPQEKSAPKSACSNSEYNWYNGAMDIHQCLANMKADYDAGPTKAVRSQSFIRILHAFLASELRGRLNPWAIQQGISVEEEVELLGSHKPKKVDIAILHPHQRPPDDSGCSQPDEFCQQKRLDILSRHYRRVHITSRPISDDGLWLCLSSPASRP